MSIIDVMSDAKFVQIDQRHKDWIYAQFVNKNNPAPSNIK